MGQRERDGQLVVEFQDPDTTEERHQEILRRANPRLRKSLGYNATTNHWNDPTDGVPGNR